MIRLQVQGGRVLDRASDRLGDIRQQRRSNMQSLRKDMTDWARQLASQAVSEEALVVIRRDRLCVPVKAGRQVSTHCWTAPLACCCQATLCSWSDKPGLLIQWQALQAGQMYAVVLVS